MAQPTEFASRHSNRISKHGRSCLRVLLILVVLMVAALALVARPSPLNPVSSTINTIGFVLTGRLHFPTERIGEVVTDEVGQRFTVFRQVIVDPAKDQPERAGAVLTLHFKVTTMSPELNQFYSLVPLPLYIGDPGFRSKLFTINGADCQSIYEWDTVQDAENYLRSIALKTILARAVPGSVSHTLEAQ
jgi:hypothetical protein